MAYTVSFGDSCPEAAFLDVLVGHVVEVDDVDYQVESHLVEASLPALLVRAWDDDASEPTGDPFSLALTGDEKVHVY